jgi:hypothetical protein
LSVTCLHHYSTDLDDDFELHGSTHGANTNTAWSDKGRAYVYGKRRAIVQRVRGIMMQDGNGESAESSLVLCGQTETNEDRAEH